MSVYAQNFLVAGRDTTAVLLTWATYELTQHPQWEDKMLNVIRRAASMEEAAHEATVQAFLHEVLRLHPSGECTALVTGHECV